MSANKPKPNVIIAPPAEAAFMEPGTSFRYVCSECTGRVQMSPEAVRRAGLIADVKIICSGCYRPEHEQCGIVPLALPQRIAPSFWRNRN